MESSPSTPQAGENQSWPRPAVLGCTWLHHIDRAFALESAHQHDASEQPMERASQVLAELVNQSDTWADCSDFVYGAQSAVRALIRRDHATDTWETSRLNPVRMMATVLVGDPAGGLRAEGDYWFRAMILAMGAHAVGLPEIAKDHADEAARTVEVLSSGPRTAYDGWAFLLGASGSAQGQHQRFRARCCGAG